MLWRNRDGIGVSRPRLVSDPSSLLRIVCFTLSVIKLSRGMLAATGSMYSVTSPPSPSFPDLHPPRPCVYLDQWVWIRLARAANGEPREDSDLQVLAAVQDAAENGVAFPLSTTHHIETSKITNPRQSA